MTNDFETQFPSNPNEATLTWSEVWTAAITKPSVATYKEILRDPGAKSRRGYTWLFIAWLIYTVVAVNVLFSTVPDDLLVELFPEATAGDISQALLLNTVCLSPFVAGIFLGVFAVIVRVIHAIVHVQGKREQQAGDVQRLSYAFAAFWAPLTLISVLLVMLPIPEIGLVVQAYQVILAVVAVRAVYDLETREAATSVLITFGGLFLINLFLLGGMLS